MLTEGCGSVHRDVQSPRSASHPWTDVLLLGTEGSLCFVSTEHRMLWRYALHSFFRLLACSFPHYGHHSPWQVHLWRSSCLSSEPLASPMPHLVFYTALSSFISQPPYSLTGLHLWLGFQTWGCALPFWVFVAYHLHCLGQPCPPVTWWKTWCLVSFSWVFPGLEQE